MALLAGAAVLPVPSAANSRPVDNSALIYVQARAAAMRGEHAQAAAMLGALADSNSADSTISRKALAQAIAAGDTALALRLARRLPTRALPIDARLLLVADDLRNRRTADALRLISSPGGDESDLNFLAPLIRSWAAAEGGDLDGALTILETVPANGLLSGYRDENRAFLYLKFRKAADAEPFARRAIGVAAGRETRLRIALADGFLASGDRDRALAMIDGMGTETASARQRVQQGRLAGDLVDTGAEAFAELLLGLAVDLNRLNNRSLPVGMVQVARFADPHNSAASVLLGLLLDAQERHDEALQVLKSVSPADPLASQARDAAARILTDLKRYDEALALANSAARDRGATVSDYARLGDTLQAMKRHREAADAYGRGVALAVQLGLRSELWPLHLLQATALEADGRWVEAKAALHAALAIAPEQPLVLNFLGYSMLERGEELDAAEAMIRKASALAPDEASITDSLGWALYKRGRLADAIETLQRAAVKDPEQAEIHEHLGDALFKAGRRYEARFAWQAALLTAEDEIADRVKAKIEAGLTPGTAAP